MKYAKNSLFSGYVDQFKRFTTVSGSVNLFHYSSENTSFVERDQWPYYQRTNQAEGANTMKKIATKDILQKVKNALTRAYAVYMMKGNFYTLSTFNINGVRRINWSGCDL
jgi:hypothetical protein